MIGFLKLSDLAGRPIYINGDSINAIYQSAELTIVITGSREINVRETVQEIMDTIYPPIASWDMTCS